MYIKHKYRKVLKYSKNKKYSNEKQELLTRFHSSHHEQSVEPVEHFRLSNRLNMYTDIVCTGYADD